MEMLKKRLMKELAKWTFLRTQKIAEEQIAAIEWQP